MTIAAQELVDAFGWSVFLLVNRKPPLGREKYGSRWGCSNNLDEINRRFNRVNNCNGVGIATGESGLLVLDVDTKTAHVNDGFGPIAELEIVYGRLADTVTSRSPSGGVHLYFKGVKGIASSASKVALGLDICARGGFVVAPPSNHGQGHYEWLSSPFDQEIAEAPHWLIYKAMFTKYGEGASLASVGIHSHRDLSHLDPNEWREHVDALVAQIQEDKRAKKTAERFRRGQDQISGIHRDERENINGFAQYELESICEGLRALNTPTGDRNTHLNGEAARVGHLIGHAVSEGALTREHVFSALMDATDGWGARHDENRRSSTINSGLNNGEISVRSGQQIRWIEAKLDKILDIHVEEAGDGIPIANDVKFLPVEEARAMFADGVNKFMHDAIKWNRKVGSLGWFVDDQYGPSRLIVAGAGTGKSQAIINVMKDYDGTHGPLLHFVPSLGLCDDLASRYEEAGIPVAVLRGRSAVDPSGNSEDDRMCPRWRMAEVAGQSNVSVTRMLCGDGEEAPHCPFFETCSYRKQALGAHVIVLPHFHLLNEDHELLTDDIFAVVIDEDFTSNLVVSPQSSDSKVLCAGDILTPARPPENDETSEVWKSDKAAELLTYQDKLRIATERSQGGYLTRQALLDAGFEPWNGTIFFNEDGDQRCDDFEPLKLATFALLWAFCGVPVGDDEQLYRDQLAERRKWLNWVAV
ncbi:MAG: bifunctional DNA primase/polymerase [Hyphomicrobiales bacterium]